MSQIQTKYIANNAVTNAKLAQTAAHTYLGNNTGSTANVLSVTNTQLTADLNLFSSSLQGLVPASGGGTVNYLRADGTFAAPPGATSGTVTSVAMTVPSFLSVSGSPITSSGTLAVTLSGTALPIANGGTNQTAFTGKSGNVAGLIYFDGTSLANDATVTDIGYNTVTNTLIANAASFATALPIASGGTNNGSLAVTAGGTLYTDGSKIVNVGVGTSGQFLTSQGSSAPTWTTGGSGTVTSVALTVPSFLSVSGSPITTSGTLAVTLATETANTIFAGPTSGGAATPTFRAAVYADIAPAITVPTVQKFTSGSGTYTTPTSPVPKYIRVRMVGGGGGGSSSGTTGSAGGSGGAGGNTTFGTSLLVANGGAAGVAPNGAGSRGNAGAGGSASLGTGPIGTAITGGTGGGSFQGDTSVILAGASGGNSPYFGGQGTGQANTAGIAAVTNTGGGGSGGSTTQSANAVSGSGGGSGGFVDAIITSPTTTYAYAVGAAGSAGSTGTFFNGTAGGSGFIVVEEYYQ